MSLFRVLCPLSVEEGVFEKRLFGCFPDGTPPSCEDVAVVCILVSTSPSNEARITLAEGIKLDRDTVAFVHQSLNFLPDTVNRNVPPLALSLLSNIQFVVNEPTAIKARLRFSARFTFAPFGFPIVSLSHRPILLVKNALQPRKPVYVRRLPKGMVLWYCCLRRALSRGIVKDYLPDADLDKSIVPAVCWIVAEHKTQLVGHGVVHG